jgi:hypothetical protein
MNCIKCETPLEGKQIKFCSVKCKNLYHQSYDVQYKRGYDKKIMAVKLLGGECSICGYKKNLAAFCFHHRDPSKKSFCLTSRQFSNNRDELLNEEIKKCILLCANCHQEEHYPQGEKWWAL